MVNSVLKEKVEALDEYDFIEFLAWVLNEEQDRRRYVEALSKAQVDQVLGLRESGVLAEPVEDAEYKPGVVFLPGEHCVVGGKRYECVSSVPTSERPGASEGVWELLDEVFEHEVEIEIED